MVAVAVRKSERELSSLAELNKLVAEVATVSCRYCFNLDHWIPVHTLVTEIECRLCNVCPMYVLVAEWDEHEEHGANATSPVVKCTKCPSCSGIIAPNEPVALCRLCEACQSYVPVTEWEHHVQEGCYGLNDIFA